jgi:hypothetical protein
MSRLDRQFADYRAQAMRHPLTAADRLVMPSVEIGRGVAMGLSVNK